MFFFFSKVVPEVTAFTADIVFLADTSSSVSQENFKNQKGITKELSKLLNADSGKSKASFVTYGSYSRVVFGLGGYKDRSDFVKQIDTAQMNGGSRRIDRALDRAWELLKQSRKNVPKITVLMTTGRQADDINAQSLDEKAALLRAVGARIYVIAFGKKPDPRELSLAVEKSDDLVRIYTMQDVTSRITPIAKKIIQDSRKYDRFHYQFSWMYVNGYNVSISICHNQIMLKYSYFKTYIYCIPSPK